MQSRDEQQQQQQVADGLGPTETATNGPVLGVVGEDLTKRHGVGGRFRAHKKHRVLNDHRHGSDGAAAAAPTIRVVDTRFPAATAGVAASLTRVPPIANLVSVFTQWRSQPARLTDCSDWEDEHRHLDLHRLLDLHERFAQVVLDQFKQPCGDRAFRNVAGRPSLSEGGRPFPHAWPSTLE